MRAQSALFQLFPVAADSVGNLVVVDSHPVIQVDADLSDGEGVERVVNVGGYVCQGGFHPFEAFPEGGLLRPGSGVQLGLQVFYLGGERIAVGDRILGEHLARGGGGVPVLVDKRLEIALWGLEHPVDRPVGIHRLVGFEELLVQVLK